MSNEYAGIDYSCGKANFDPETGIHFGVISLNSGAMQAICDAQEFDYPEPCCQDCEQLLTEAANDCDVLLCVTCKNVYSKSKIEMSDESVGWHIDDGGYRIDDCLDNDCMITKSKYYTWAQYCSPCVPGAGNLDHPLSKGVGVKTFCLDPEWFDGPCPYDVYWVADDTCIYEVPTPEQTEPTASWSVTDHGSLKRSAKFPNKMNALYAANDSLNKWQAVLDRLQDMLDNGVDGRHFPFADGDDCALCEQFYDNDNGNDMDSESDVDGDEYPYSVCSNCPLSKHTGRVDCYATPYGDYKTACRTKDLPGAHNAALRFVVLLKQVVNRIKAGEL